jgi:xanthine dehydrogenase YagT iron-sulfur-binding subunit
MEKDRMARQSSGLSGEQRACERDYPVREKWLLGSNGKRPNGGCMQEEEKVFKDVSRRSFIKIGGLAAAGAGVINLGNAAVAPAQALAAEIEELYTCPIDGKHFSSYEEIKAHFESNHPESVIPEMMTLSVNGSDIRVQVEPHWTLQETLQFALGLTGAKTMCDRGGCGSCSVLINGEPNLSCATLAIECEGKQIQTIEGIAADEQWKPLFDAFAANDGNQCGYCSPGQVVVAKYVIEKYGDPTDEQIASEMASNICRCGTYQRHAPAIHDAVKAMSGGGQ